MRLELGRSGDSLAPPHFFGTRARPPGDIIGAAGAHEDRGGGHALQMRSLRRFKQFVPRAFQASARLNDFTAYYCPNIFNIKLLLRFRNFICGT